MGAPENIKELHDATEQKFKELRENVEQNQEKLMKALEEARTEGTLHGKTNEELKALSETGQKLQTELKAMQDRMLEIEQKGGSRAAGGEKQLSAGQSFIESDNFKAVAALNGKGKQVNVAPVAVKNFMRKAAVLGTRDTAITQSPLVAPDVRPDIIMPGTLRMTIRDLLPQNQTNSNLIVFPKENVYTNNAGPQYDSSSPAATTEGAIKSESGITFTMDQAAVVTLAHWIPASDQVLKNAPMLQGYIDGRLRYGLALEEESELLTGDGTSGTISGLINNATAFNGGATNQTALDTLLKAKLQISLSYYETSGIVLHPSDWTNIVLLKDTQGRYLFSDPQSMVQPRVWATPVVATPNMTQGSFLAGAFDMAAEIFDSEEAYVSISNQHADFFTRNLVAIRAEESLALAVYRSAAIVTGALSYAG